MKKLLFMVAAGVAILFFMGSPTIHAEEDDESARDHIKVEKITAGGAKVTVVEGTDVEPGAGENVAPGEADVTVVEGTDAATGEDYVEATRVTTNTVRVPVVRERVEVPVALTAPHKARLAVLPAVFSKHFQPVFEFREKIEVSGQVNLKMIFTAEHEYRLEAPSFTVSLAEAFVNSRKFDVLERARLNEVLKEIDFGESDYGDVAKVVPMGQALNAEYVALPEIEVIHLTDEVKDVPYVDTVSPRLKGKMIVRLRVVDTGSTKTVAAFTEEVQVERRLKANNPFLQSEINNLVMDLYQAAALRSLHRTLDAVYPVRLLEVAAGKAVLNRGEGAISQGDEFDVYTLGKTYVDPDTNETLGQGETQVALIRVTRIAPKFAEAEILEGAEQLTGEVQGFLCRETEKSIESKARLEQSPIAW